MGQVSQLEDIDARGEQLAHEAGEVRAAPTVVVSAKTKAKLASDRKATKSQEQARRAALKFEDTRQLLEEIAATHRKLDTLGAAKAQLYWLAKVLSKEVVRISKASGIPLDPEAEEAVQQWRTKRKF